MTVLQVTLESSGTLYWPAEMARKTGLTEPTVYRVYDKLSKAGIVRKKPEHFPSNVDHPNHPPRNLYEVTDHGVAVSRLTPLSSLSSL
jgi:hypothetical protein